MDAAVPWRSRRGHPLRAWSLGVAGLIVLATSLSCGASDARDLSERAPASVAASTEPTVSTTAPPAAPAPPSSTAASVPPPATSTPPVPYTAVATRSAGLGEFEPERVVAPVGLRIDAIDVDAEIVAVGADASGRELAVPPTAELVAWYQHGPTPGAGGSAVLAAHVGYGGVAGAFVRLSDLPVGDEVTVEMADGRALRFRVTDVVQVPKPELPTDSVFARDGVPRLVLVTCGGEFETSTRHYRDNIVAYLEAA